MKKLIWNAKWIKANKERAETLPGAVATAIVSSIILLGVAGAMTFILSLQSTSESRASIQNAANNIETSFRTDSGLATKILAVDGSKAIAFHFQSEEGVGECRVATWQINDTSLVRTLRVFPNVKGQGCDNAGTEITGSTKTFTNSLNTPPTFAYFNDLNREIKIVGTTAVFANPADVCPLNQNKGADADCVITDPLMVDAWNSTSIGKVAFSYTLSNEHESITRNITQDTSTPLYQSAKPVGETGEAEAELTHIPGAPTVSRVGANPYVNTNSTFVWVDNINDNPVPVGYVKKYLVQTNGVSQVVAGNEITFRVGATPPIVRVQKLYVRASVTITGPPGIATAVLPNAPYVNTSTPVVVTAPTSSFINESIPVSWTATTCLPAASEATPSYTLYANNTKVYSGIGRSSSYTPPASALNTKFHVVASCNVLGFTYDSPASNAVTTKHMLKTPTVNAPTKPRATQTSINETLSITATCAVGSPRYQVVNTTRNNRSAWLTSVSNYAINNSAHGISWGNAYNYRVEVKCVSSTHESTVVNSANIPVNLNSGTMRLVYNCPANSTAYIPVTSFRGQVTYSGKTAATTHVTSVGASGVSRAISAGGADTVVTLTGYFGEMKGGTGVTAQKNCVRQVSLWNPNPDANQRGATNMFADFKNLTAVAAPPTTITNMNGMFRDATSFNGTATSTWKTPNVTNMSAMFTGATNFNRNISSWDTSKVTTMSYMFDKATKFNQPIGTWNTGKVTSMVSMFREAKAMNRSLNSWNTANVTNMSNMFATASAFNGDIGNWNTAKVTSLASTFNAAVAFNKPINNWNVANVTDMSNTFRSTYAFNQALSKWNTVNVTRLDLTFYDARAFNQSIDAWNVAKVTRLDLMFAQALVYNKPMNNWKTANVTTMESTFNRAHKFNQPLDKWNTAKVTTMFHMFYVHAGQEANFNRSIKNWNVSKVTNWINFRCHTKLTAANSPSKFGAVSSIWHSGIGRNVKLFPDTCYQ